MPAFPPRAPPQVAVRVRPFTAAEIAAKEPTAVAHISDGVLRLTPPDGSHARKFSAASIDFEFGRVHTEASTQAEVYSCHARDMVHGLFSQHNSLLFVYGVSNSGKTFTISGPKQNPGIVPLALADAFAMADGCRDAFEIRVSYFEFYIKNEVYDLLASADDDDAKKKSGLGGSAKKVAPSQRSSLTSSSSSAKAGGGHKSDAGAHGKCISGKIVGNAITFPGLTEAVVVDTAQALRLLDAGQRRKHVESTVCESGGKLNGRCEFIYSREGVF